MKVLVELEIGDELVKEMKEYMGYKDEKDMSKFIKDWFDGLNKDEKLMKEWLENIGNY